MTKMKSHRAWEKELLCQAETKGTKHEAITKQNNILQAKTEGAKYEARTKQTNFLQAGHNLQTRARHAVQFVTLA